MSLGRVKHFVDVATSRG